MEVHVWQAFYFSNGVDPKNWSAKGRGAAMEFGAAAQPLTLPPFSMTVLSSDSAARLKGDLNGNGGITAFDAALVLQAVVGAITLDPRQQCAGDYNDNGSVTAFDASLILQCAVGGACSTATCN